ncbi:MAG TPA: tetratricopeptide repeat protein [Ferruginibacter sp.]|nr:tetratricopeptide repeat protein [Ferruginibacter sp.]
MKKLIIISLFSICTSFLNAQPNRIDSLKQLLQKEEEDTSRVLLLNQLSDAYLQSKPDTTLLLSQEGLSLARKIGFDKGEAQSLTIIGNAYNILGNYLKALENLFQASNIYEKNGDQKGILRSLIGIAVNHSNRADFRQALDYSFKAKALAEEIKSARGITISLINIANYYDKLIMFDSARLFAQQAYEMAMRNNDISLIGGPLLILGNVHNETRQYPLSLEYYRLSIPYLKMAEDNEHLISVYICLADLFEKTKQNDSCLFYSKKAFEQSKRGGFTSNILLASKSIYNSYKNKNVLDSALKYLEISFETKDSLFNQDQMGKLESLTFNEKIRQMEMESEKLKAKEQRRQNIEYAGIAIALIIFLSLFLLLSRSIIVNAKWIKLMGIIGLLLVFEFINLLIGPYVARVTNNSAILILLIVVGVATLLVPIHNKLEKWVIEKLVEKNKKIRLAAAKKTIEELEKEN